MKKNRKILWIILAAVLAVVLLFPVKLRYKDGGTVSYRALLYSVTKYHAIDEVMPGEDGNYTWRFLVGTEVKLLGFTVFDNTRYEPAGED